MENLWIIKDSGGAKKDIDEIKAFITEQNNYLSSATEGRVLAHFIPKRTAKLTVSAKAVSRAVQGKTGKNACDLLEPEIYEYYISDAKNEYELNLFYFIFNYDYPFVFEIDFDMAEKLNMPSENFINSVNDFEDLFAKIVKTSEVVYIVNKLNEMQKDKE
ncbi:MAG: hypothetical protein IKJ57_05760 [Oscillospiraceae bacterium]|nr:hypothetical protein [Oscillospiraceae bacterium]